MNMQMNDAHQYFIPGDIVTIRHDIPNKPIAWVVEKVSRNIKNRDTGEQESTFLGIKCRWFNANGDLQEAIFSTKDIMPVR